MTVGGISVRLIQKALIAVAILDVLVGVFDVAISPRPATEAIADLIAAFYDGSIALAYASLIEIGIRIWIVLSGAEES